MHRDAKYEDLVSSAGVVLATTVVERTSGLPVAGVGEHGTRGATRIVERRRAFLFVTLYFSLVFLLSYNFWWSASGRLRLDGSWATHPLVLFLH